jgi:hypothetical protein
MKAVGLVLILIVSLFFFNCGSSKTYTSIPKTFLIDNTKVKRIESVSFQKWVAGKEESGYGYHIEITQSRNNQMLQLQHIYFRGLKGDISLGKKNYVANLKNEVNKDIQLSSDSSDEYENTLPELGELPFLLNDNECVISYITNHTIKFIKFINIKEKPAEYYPSAKPRN